MINEFEIKLPSEYLEIVFRGQSPEEQLKLNMNGTDFVIRVKEISWDINHKEWHHSWKPSSELRGVIQKVKSEKEKLQEQLDNLIKEVESVKEKLRNMK